MMTYIVEAEPSRVRTVQGERASSSDDLPTDSTVTIVGGPCSAQAAPREDAFAIDFTQRDACLRGLLESESMEDEDFWSFRGNSVREHAHGCFQYPAMTVPQLQRHLLQSVYSVVPELTRVFDPFVGSGTTMTESMLQGFEFHGTDINPLAVLLCHSKSSLLNKSTLSEIIDYIAQQVAKDNSNSVAVNFNGLNKWFRADVAVQLSRIRRAIQSVTDGVARRICWVALAETIRLSSNSRTSTFKLHIRPREQVATREIQPYAIFLSVLKANVTSLLDQATELEKRGHIRDGRLMRSVDVRLQDAARPYDPADGQHDLLITSPPYGDNTTTVPYGQHSYLPLQWIDPTDLDPRYDPGCLVTTHEIDRRSLGGNRKHALKEIEALRQRSPALHETLHNLAHEPRDRSLRVAAFFRDMDRTLDPILSRLRPNAYMVWTVGNRSVGKRPVPLDAILTELLTSRGAVTVATIVRRIPSKRMAVKNSVTMTMRYETILILRKGQ